jgi:hypothetical protein
LCQYLFVAQRGALIDNQSLKPVPCFLRLDLLLVQYNGGLMRVAVVFESKILLVPLVGEMGFD